MHECTLYMTPITEIISGGAKADQEAETSAEASNKRSSDKSSRSVQLPAGIAAAAEVWGEPGGRWPDSPECDTGTHRTFPAGERGACQEENRTASRKSGNGPSF